MFSLIPMPAVQRLAVSEATVTVLGLRWRGAFVGVIAVAGGPV